MKYKKIQNKYVIKIDKGEEVVNALKKFCRANKIRFGVISGIGATNKVTLDYVDTETKKHELRELIGEHRITDFSGKISFSKGRVHLDTDVSILDSHDKVFGGSLSSAFVSDTCEVIIDTVKK